MFGTMNARLLFLLLLLVASPSPGQWLVLPPFDQRQTTPPQNWNEGKAIQVGDAWPTDQKFRWLVAELTGPGKIEQKSCAGEPVGMRINCGDGGEVWINGALQGRFDNDHPALALVSERAVPGQKVRVAIQVYGKVQGGDRFSEANWTIIEPKRAREPLTLEVHPEQLLGPVPHGIVGLSQGGGMSDYDAATAKKLREGGFKWFRMDNVLTGVLKKGADGKLADDWGDFDKRLDFMAQIGADPIICVSYMPQILDAVPNGERQSAPRDYGVWEELCFRAARHAIQRDRRVPFWEVWNEVNAGWLKPGPEDTGGEPFKSLYNQALGKAETDREVVRRFEAYCKLYRATARGVRRADPDAKIGGPALASGPFENSEHGSCQHGRGFARGLILFCARENLPLDFVSWHEYFQEASMIAEEARAFRGYLADQPRLAKSVRSFMITEWNQAWWADRPHDHELGAAWCADGVVRSMLPEKIDRPCFFYVKQNDMSFRGDFSLLMQGNQPKASYNMAKIFNGLSGQWVSLSGTDGEVSGVAAWDQKQERLAMVLVNFTSRYNLPRKVAIAVEKLPRELRNGVWRESIVDTTHGNIWHDRDRAELAVSKTGSVADGRFELSEKLMPNSITLVEVSAGSLKR